MVLVLLAGCRYTFWPPVPQEAPSPALAFVEVALKAEGESVVAEVRAHRVPEPGYLLFRWYRNATLVVETARWVEGPSSLRLVLPAEQNGAYRLEIWWQGERVEVALWGRPSPPRTAPPEWKEN